MKSLNLFLIISLFVMIFGQDCTISNTKNNGVTNYESCKDYTTSSSSKVCCYVKGEDDIGNTISACQELTGTEIGALTDLNEIQGYSNIIRHYYLKADCNLGKEISLCDPNDQRSETSLSVDYCSKYKVIRALGIDNDSKCCYVSGVSVDKKNVYSCVGIEPFFYDKETMANDIESGEYERLGALTNIKIECPGDGDSANFYSVSIVTFIIALFFLWFGSSWVIKKFKKDIKLIYWF